MTNNPNKLAADSLKIADACRREDGSDIPLGAHLREVAEALQRTEPAPLVVEVRATMLAGARIWWERNMPSRCTNVVIKGDGRVDVYWSDADESGRYTLPVDFLAALASQPSPEIGGVERVCEAELGSPAWPDNSQEEMLDEFRAFIRYTADNSDREIRHISLRMLRAVDAALSQPSHDVAALVEAAHREGFYAGDNSKRSEGELYAEHSDRWAVSKALATLRKLGVQP